MSDRVADVRARLNQIMQPWAGSEAPSRVQPDTIKDTLMNKTIESLKNSFKDVAGRMEIEGEHIDNTLSIISVYNRKYRLAYNISIFWGVFNERGFVAPKVTISDFTITASDTGTREASDLDFVEFNPYESSSFYSRIVIALKEKIFERFKNDKDTFKKFMDGEDVVDELTSIEASGVPKPKIEDIFDTSERVMPGSKYSESATAIIIKAINDLYRVKIKAKKPITVGGVLIAKNQQKIVNSKELANVPEDDYYVSSQVKPLKPGEPITKELVLANMKSQGTEDERLAYSILTGMTPVTFQNLLDNLED